MQGCKNLCLKKSRHKRESRLNIATYNITTLRDEHIQELEEKFRESRLVWNVIEISEVRRRRYCFTTLQSGRLLYQSKVNNGQIGVGFLINMEWKDHIVWVNNIIPRVAELKRTLYRM